MSGVILEGMAYDADTVTAQVAPQLDRLFAPWRVGRPDGWIPDPRTKELVCIGLWLREELTRLGLSDTDRKTQEGYYHRHSRSDENLYELAAKVLNDAVAGDIPQNRKPHRRWG